MGVSGLLSVNQGETCNSNGNGIPLLNGPTEFSIRFPDPVQFTTDPKRISEVNDILFCVRGSTTGRMNWANQKYALGRGLAAIRHKYGDEYRYFIRGIIDFNLSLLLSSASGSTFPNISRDQLNDLEIMLPPLPEQKAIASILSSLDDKIDLLHRQNRTLEAIAETLFRQWFIEEAQEDWEEDDISQLVSIQNGYAFKSRDFKGFGQNGVLKIKNISGGVVNIDNTDFIDEAITENISSRFQVKSGDVLIGMTGAEIGKLGVVPNTQKLLWLNQRVGLLKEKFKGSRFLAYIQLSSEFGQDFIKNTATGSAQPNISSIGIESCYFPQVAESRIKECSVQIELLYEKLIFNLGQIQTLKKLRDNLLPKLMSGEVQVKLSREE